MSDPLVTLWTAQQISARPLSPAELAKRAAVLRRRVWRRDLTEYAAGVFVIAGFGYVATVVSDMGMRIASLVLIAGTALVLWNLWRRRPKDDPGALARDALSHYRAQLTSQHDMLASVARWYLGPLVPGVALLILATIRASATTMPLAAALAVGAVQATVVGAVFWGIYWLNRAAARSLDAQIAALDSDAAPPLSTDTP